jgi:hypothetical protein
VRCRDEDSLLRLAYEDLRALLGSLGVPVDSCLERLEQYGALLQQEAAKWNITKYRKAHEVVLYHLVDSLQSLRCPGTEGVYEVIDVGTGAGSPGVPCALATSDEALRELCGTFVEALRYRLRGRDSEHAVLVIRLCSAPDERYPRSAARMRRQPLG